MSFGDRSTRVVRHGPTPLWQQVAADIASDISSGRLSPGDRLPSLIMLTHSYGVSRITIRSAIRNLRDDGKVEVVQGRGTFVSVSR